MKALLVLMMLLSGCKEFYDEEFEEFQREQARTTGGSGSNEDVSNASYSTQLAATDANVPDMTGTARIDVRDNEVTIDLDADGVPSNIFQLHYGYMGAACGTLQVGIPNTNIATRSITVSERITVDALETDLISSGASSGDNDINLAGKSLIVKAFSNLGGGNETSAQIIILCGEITADDASDEAATTGTIGTTTGTTGTFGTTTGTTTGTFGTTTATTTGTFGTTTGTFGATTGTTGTTGSFGTTGTSF